jgi:dTDP-glucose pyrophosphorylase
MLPQLNIISSNATIKDAINLLNTVGQSGAVLYVISEGNHALIGTLTDGDIRRGILNNIDVGQSPEAVCNKDYFWVEFSQNWIQDDVLKKAQAKGIKHIPLLHSDRTLVKIIDLSVYKSFLPLDAVIMAGGQGTRLRPLTLTTPKPLLKVGSKPIIEHNVDRLKSFGIQHITISINYLGDQLVTYFGDGTKKDLKINYVEENKPLGTIGALGLIGNYENDNLLIMNSDLLTTINFEDIYDEFIETKADMIVATTTYEVKIPYGVVETDGNEVISLAEKPTYTYYSNAGIYIIKKELVDLIPKNEHFNATDLMEKLFQMKKKVVNYPILDYWLDIGKHHDYEKAQKDIKHLEL